MKVSKTSRDDNFLQTTSVSSRLELHKRCMDVYSLSTVLISYCLTGVHSVSSACRVLGLTFAMVPVVSQVQVVPMVSLVLLVSRLTTASFPGLPRERGKEGLLTVCKLSAYLRLVNRQHECIKYLFVHVGTEVCQS